MPNQKNIGIVTLLEEKLNKGNSFVVTNYQGLTHKQLEELHRQLRTVKAEFVVVKNTLLKIASKDKLKATGPTAVLISYGEGFDALKELYKYIKATTFPKVKFSVINDTQYDEVETARIAALPNKEGLIAQLMFTLNANTQKLAYILTQIKK